MKSVVFGHRRGTRGGRASAGSLDAALPRARAAGDWQVPERLNFARDVVQVFAKEPKRQALTFVGNDGVIEPWTFLQLAQGAARWAAHLRKHRVDPGDRVLVVEAASPEWVEIMLAGIKIGAVSVPCAPTLGAAALDIRIAASGAKLVVATRAAEAQLIATAHDPAVLYVDEARRQAHRLPRGAPTHNTSAHDPAFIVSTSGRTNGPRGVLHTHGATFAARVHTEHWLDAGLGDVVWCTARTNAAQGPLEHASRAVVARRRDRAPRRTYGSDRAARGSSPSPGDSPQPDARRISRAGGLRSALTIPLGQAASPRLDGRVPSRRPDRDLRAGVGSDDPRRVRAGRDRDRRRTRRRHRLPRRVDRASASRIRGWSDRSHRERAPAGSRGRPWASRTSAVPLRRVLERNRTRRTPPSATTGT